MSHDSTENGTGMTHDPLCEWSTPCIHGENQQHSRDTENLAVPDATYCWMCGVDCHCDLIAKVQEDIKVAAFREGQLAERARIAIMLRALAGGYELGRSDWEVGWRAGVKKAALMVELP